MLKSSALYHDITVGLVLHISQLCLFSGIEILEDCRKHETVAAFIRKCLLAIALCDLYWLALLLPGPEDVCARLPDMLCRVIGLESC